MARLKTLKPELTAPSPRIARPAELVSNSKDRPAWYSSKRWRRLRLKALERDGYRCVQTGVALVGPLHAPNSPVVDHIEPHHWDERLFYDLDNLQSVSKEWHDREKQRIERRGFS